MSEAVKSGIFFGVTMAIWFILSNIFFFPDGRDNLWINIFSGILGGAFSGLLFGLSSRWFLKKITRVKPPSLDPDETVVLASNANHFKGAEAVGGRLFLTNKRLIFKPHAINLQPHELVIAVTDIKTAYRVKTLGLVNNGLIIQTPVKKERFVVSSAAQWMQHLAANNNLPKEPL